MLMMPHSTTGTTSYVLQKYSRAYPKKRGQGESQNNTDVISEWQHYTNPTIRLFLDVKSTPNGGTESVRLRVMWKLSAEHESSNNQQEFTFEDLDMLSFSDMLSGSAQKRSSEGLPLKAVYRDTVVGIRYLHNQDLGDALAYRRFQVSFQSISEAEELLEAIKPFCHCKKNPAPIQGPQPINVAAAPIGSASQPHRVAIARQNTELVRPLLPTTKQNLVGQTISTHITVPVAMAQIQQPSLSVHTPLPIRPSPHLGHLTSSSDSLSSSPMRDLRNDLGPPFPRRDEMSANNMLFSSQQHSMPPPPPPEPPAENWLHQNNRLEIASSLPPSSVPGSSGEHTQWGQDGHRAPIRELVAGHPDPLADLSQVCSIYDLTALELENVIGGIIREEGFSQMVERISEMMAIRRITRV